MNLKKILKGFLPLFFMLFIASQAGAVGVGVIVGEPTGLSLKFGDFPVLGISWSLDKHLYIHADAWILNRPLKGKLNWYFGLGGKVLIFDDESDIKKEVKDEDSDVGLGARVPFGLQYYFIPELELFGEVVPGLLLFPATDFDIDFGIGLRYHF
jgi:hypothetical protein